VGRANSMAKTVLEWLRTGIRLIISSRGPYRAGMSEKNEDQADVLRRGDCCPRSLAQDQQETSTTLGGGASPHHAEPMTSGIRSREKLSFVLKHGRGRLRKERPLFTVQMTLYA